MNHSEIKINLDLFYDKFCDLGKSPTSRLILLSGAGMSTIQNIRAGKAPKRRLLRVQIAKALGLKEKELFIESKNGEA